jgi:hypothetical protein
MKEQAEAVEGDEEVEAEEEGGAEVYNCFFINIFFQKEFVTFLHVPVAANLAIHVNLLMNNLVKMKVPQIIVDLVEVVAVMIVVVAAAVVVEVVDGIIKVISQLSAKS